MRNVQGDVSEAGPSLAVQMLGLNNVPQAGDEFTVFATESEARVAGGLGLGLLREIGTVETIGNSGNR
jgi:translation initiation factor IF-2